MEKSGSRSASAAMRRPRRRSQPCRRCVVSARRRNFARSLSRPESDAPQQVGEARVFPKGFIIRAKNDDVQRAGSSLEVSFEPGESLILIAKTGVHRGDIQRERLSSGVPLLQLSQSCPFLMSLS